MTHFNDRAGISSVIAIANRGDVDNSTANGLDPPRGPRAAIIQMMNPGHASEVLPYAEAELPEGVTELTIDSRPGVRAVRVPAATSPALHPWQTPLTVAALIASFAGLILCAACAPAADPVAFSLFFTAVTITGLNWFSRVERRRLQINFEINQYEFRMTTGNIFGTTRRRWPRCKLSEIYLSPISGAMVIRLIKDDPVDVRVSDDPAIARRVTHELSAALMAIPAAPPGTQLHPADPSAGLPPGPAKTALHWSGLALTVVAFAGIPFSHGLSLYGLVPAAICVGIALGTQRKDVWV
jgi:hypothetical protein